MKIFIILSFVGISSLTINAGPANLAVPEIINCEVAGFLNQCTKCAWKKPDGDESSIRSSQSYNNYKNWCEKANTHNQDPTSTYTRKITCFSNLNINTRSSVQFGIVKLNLTRPVRSAKASCRYAASTTELPKSVDWRELAKPVRDQKSCGSCWAHTTIGLCEAYHKKVKKESVLLSIQDLVSCDTKNKGCDGGNVDVAGDYIHNKKIETEENYPYTSGDEENQANDFCMGGFGEKTCPRIVKEQYPMLDRSGNCNRLKDLLQYSPVGIYMFAEDEGFLQYSDGVFSSNTLQGTTDTSTDHAVIAVGYTVLNGVEVFIIQNSWGTTWGQDGYVYVKAKGNQLNICTEFFYYNVFKPEC